MVFSANPFERSAREGLALFQKGDLDGAKRIFEQLAASAPPHPDVWQVLGMIAASKGEHRDAARHLEKALRMVPDHPEVNYNYGVTLLALGRHAEAIRPLEKAAAARPTDHDTLNNLGAALLNAKRYDAARDALDRLLVRHPRSAQGHYHMAGVLIGQQRPAEAIGHLEKALACGADNAADIRHQLGVAHHMLRHYDQAASALSAAIALAPDHADAHARLGETLIEQGNRTGDAAMIERGIASFQRALALRPGHVGTLLDLADGLFDLRRYTDALPLYDQVLKANSGHALALLGKACCQRYLCDWRDMAKTERRALDVIQSQRVAVPPFTSLFLSDDPDLQLKTASRYAETFPAQKPLTTPGPRTRSGPVRLGYLSGDLRQHAVAFLAAELFELHDRSRFEVTGFSYGPDDGSPMRHRLEEGIDRFLDVQAFTDAEIAAEIARREIDILVDLTGFTQDGRFGVLTHRPAPIQVSYLGHPGTLGSTFADYVIADGFVIPEGQDRTFAEKIVRLPGAYQVNDRKRAVSTEAGTRADHGLPESGLVLCCFNNAHKITPDIFAIWMRVMKAAPDSVLWLYAREETVRANLRKEAVARGVAGERLVFAETMPNDRHLARLKHADLVLDTLPYNAHTTASDALWVGVPVLTCAGRTFAARVAGSLLNAVGLPELVTTRLADYEALALGLATEPEQLASFKARLTATRDSAPLFGTDVFCRHLEAAYLEMLRRHDAGEPLSAITISAGA